MFKFVSKEEQDDLSYNNRVSHEPQLIFSAVHCLPPVITQIKDHHEENSVYSFNFVTFDFPKQELLFNIIFDKPEGFSHAFLVIVGATKWFFPSTFLNFTRFQIIVFIKTKFESWLLLTISFLMAHLILVYY